MQELQIKQVAYPKQQYKLVRIKNIHLVDAFTILIRSYSFVGNFYL